MNGPHGRFCACKKYDEITGEKLVYVGLGCPNPCHPLEVKGNKGMINLIVGPMFSGKTREVVRRLERASIAGKRVILLRPKNDTRGFLSHSPLEISWLEEKFVDLEDFDASNFDVIGIDEGQFMTGLKDFCVKNSLLGKQIVVSALHSSSECEMFDPIIELVPHAEEIEKLNAVCTECGYDTANYTFFLGGSKTEKVSVGGSEKYTALCLNCYTEGMSR